MTDFHKNYKRCNSYCFCHKRKQ